MKEEIWKEVKGYANGFYDGLYEISDFGRFKILPRILNCKGGSRLTKEKIVEGSNSNGYRRVHLKKDRIALQIDIHILVAKAFIPNPENKPTVNHKDSVRHNNRVENLEWATQLEQNEHTIRMGRANRVKGVNKSNSKLTEDDVREIKRLYLKTNTTFRKIGQQFGISYTTVRDIMDRKKWKHVA